MFFKRKKRNIREYMKYKDGKIVSIAVENQNSHVDYDEIPDEMNLEPEPKVSKWKTINWNKFLVWNNLKKLLYLLLIIFFIWTMFDIYKAFFAENSTEPPSNSTSVSTEPTNKNPSVLVPDNEKENTSTPANENPPSSTTPSNEETETEQPVLNDEESALNETQSIFIFARNVNNSLFKSTADEIDKLNRYIDRKSNIIGLKNQFDRSYSQKEELYVRLVSAKPLFENNNLSGLYHSLESRLLNSISFSKKLKEITESQKSYAEFSMVYNEFVEEDDRLRKNITESMIQSLEEHNIPYEYNEITEELTFEIPLPAES